MTREELKKHIDLYKKTEETVTELGLKYGVILWNSPTANFYNNYNLLIHNLLVSIFGDAHTDMIEEFAFDQSNITFDELCNSLEI